ncbi:hypothetical protein CapIbe_011626 [Capra ibex]
MSLQSLGGEVFTLKKKTTKKSPRNREWPCSSVGCCQNLDDRIAETPSVLNQARGARQPLPKCTRDDLQSL